ncbi:acetyl-CoA carboxylase biotin carboxylase subunit [Alicyclobacillus tolerans]|uniref:biotin carboxylase n=1 Tax=Alicyclobacillus tolerans TaxID=90970 RepID=A0ABT9LW11_9BACL|nr:acetyl-CoA carboxylase biotin carboxylase subunit [Alicyclobacillus tengchongensis]MDP9728376.1 acetyl-CoA carboxylase biotin carboxylase subunit [Alicyclobacillus tengchongensis]
MITKLLIANRGEIARRIIRTCKRMGISTVAVYSDADESALFVKEADERVRIGPPPVAESYLKIDAILEAAQQTGADAIHPGYGLLSEHADFAKRVRQQGLIFVGPPEAAIAAMGSKVEARRRMSATGLPIVPGTENALASLEEAIEAAERIGYPVMLKASSGGGGIGMQIIRDAEELKKAFAGSQARAASYFGNGDLFLEKYIEKPHHVEIQVLLDSQGNGVHLGDRECSIQRRHQKVVEEAPSPLLSAALRQEMGSKAVQAALSLGYEGVGTFEFLADESGNYYFLEMNTRLQVEHPVTEQITGLDLVEWQLRVASGESLTFQQQDVHFHGHSIEARVYAEDPVRGFPSPGKLQVLDLPEGMEGVRLDFGFQSGDTITPFYDPLIGKLVVTASTRAEAIQLLQKALNTCQITGIKSNLPQLQAIAKDERFLQGLTDTSFLTGLSLNS